MRRVSTATCTSGDPVSPSCFWCSRMISSLCSTTANFFFLLFAHFSLCLTHSTLYATTCINRYRAPKPPSAQSISYDPGLPYVAPVKVTLEIEEVGLDAALGAPEGRSYPDVRTSGIFLFAKADESCVDPAGRYHGVGIGQHVGCREADRPAALVSDHYLAPEHVGTSEEACSLGHFSTGDQSPYTGGADPASHAPAAYLNTYGRSTFLPHEPVEVTEVAEGLVPETKVLADYDHSGPTLANQHFLYELLWSLPGHGDIERYHPYLISPISE